LENKYSIADRVQCPPSYDTYGQELNDSKRTAALAVEQEIRVPYSNYRLVEQHPLEHQTAIREKNFLFLQL
jgi:hypothetical protein